MKVKSCTHLDDITEVKTASVYECTECIKTGDTWVHLRTCQTCGETHCCDSSVNQHATHHYREEGHGVVASAEPGEQWLWCYKDKLFKPY